MGGSGPPHQAATQSHSLSIFISVAFVTRRVLRLFSGWTAERHPVRSQPVCGQGRSVEARP